MRRGVKPGQRRLFVIDGSKALRAAIDAVFGKQNPAQPAAAGRRHKIENVMGYLPDHLKDQVKAAMRAAYRLPAKEGMARLEKQAGWLEREFPSAARRPKVGITAHLLRWANVILGDNHLLGLWTAERCLSSTNIIESPNGGMRLRTRRVCGWRDGRMVLRWAAAALSMTEKHFRKIMGYRDLWVLKAALEENQTTRHIEVA